MRRIFSQSLRLLWILPVLLWLVTLTPCAQAQGSGGNDFVPGEVVVKLSSTTVLNDVATQYGLDPTPLDQFGTRPIYRLRIADGSQVEQKVAALLADPQSRVIYAEPNFISSAPEASKPSWGVGDSYGTGGDYAAYQSQWLVQKIHLPTAQSVSRGAGVTVAVLDTGVDATHPALVGHLVPGYDFVDMDNDPSEVGSQELGPYGHGTHVAGLVALVAPDARIMPLRVLDPYGKGNVWVIAEALAYAVEHGAKVINLSLGTLRRTNLLESVISESCNDIELPNDDFRAANVVVVAAAGNTGDSSNFYPAAENINGLLAVAASTETDGLATFSTRGSWIQVMSPGDRILSTVPGGLYGTWRGTSMASPIAAGEAALVRAAFPRLKQAKIVRQIERNAIEIQGVRQPRIDAGAALTNAPAIEPTIAGDFDGDGRTDISVWQSDSGKWHIINSTDSFEHLQFWGQSSLGDIGVPGDYDGDGKTDIAIFRPSEGNWYIIKSSDGTAFVQGWGQSSDRPVPADYDGDGKTDQAVYRPSEGNWYVRKSTGGSIVQGWGDPTDKLVPGDYDGDGRADIAVWRPSDGNWYILKSTGGLRQQQWGLSEDKPVAGDYDGDDMTDLAVYRPAEGNWYIIQSSGGATVRNWGDSADRPVPGDYDGDGQTDIAVWRPSEGTWYVLQSATNTGAQQFLGSLMDTPIPSAYLPQ